MKKRTIYTFLSYSSHDKEFVVKLESSLSSIGIPCFLDDKDIKIGDSIHRMVIEGIERSTHLIHVISKHSINSRWVREELEIAHVKLMEGNGYKILPLLIDEIELPTTIKHIKVGDFRWWRTQERYYAALDSLLDALDFKNPITLNLETKVFVSNLNFLIQAMSKWEQTYKLIDYGLDCIDGENGEYLIGIAFKRVYDLDILELIKQLHILFDEFKEAENQKIIDVQLSIQELEHFLLKKDRTLTTTFHSEKIQDYYQFKQNAHALSVALGSIVEETQRLFVLEHRSR